MPRVDGDVLVVGAGIAGLSTAARLQELGLEVEVAERAPTLRAAGAGIVLHPNALRLLPHVGAAVRAEGAPIERQLTIDPDGSTTLVDWRAVWDGELPVAIHRRRLAELLFRRLTPGTVMFAATVGQLRQEDEAVAVEIGADRVRRYRLVIGADGTRSVVRRAVDIDTSPRYLGQTYWRTTVQRVPPLDFDEWRVWRGGRHFFGVMPIGGSRAHVSLQASLPRPRRIAAARVRATMAELAESMGPTVSGLVAGLEIDDDLLVRPALGLVARRWADARVALVGDAVHSVSPATTQGGALAIEDAAVLASEVARQGPTPAACEAYERRRSERIDRFVRMERLHRGLIEAVQDRPLNRLSPSFSHGRAVDRSRWFRRVYEALREAA